MVDTRGELFELGRDSSPRGFWKPCAFPFLISWHPRKGHEELEQRLHRLESEATRHQAELEEARRVVEWHDVTEIRSFFVFHRIFYTSDVHPSGSLGSLVGP